MQTTKISPLQWVISKLNFKFSIEILDILTVAVLAVAVLARQIIDTFFYTFFLATALLSLIGFAFFVVFRCEHFPHNSNIVIRLGKL